MFERRVKLFLIVLSVVSAVVVLRLAEIQVLDADTYRAEAANALLLQRKTLRPVRGAIRDRTGRVLAADEPSWDIQVDYGVLAMDPDYLARQVRKFRRAQRYGADLSEAEVETAWRAEIDRMWRDLARFSGSSDVQLSDRADEICARVERVRAAVRRRHGYDIAVAEERSAHAVLEGLDDQRQVEARQLLGAYPWVHIVASKRRALLPGHGLAHVLGQMGPVDAERITTDPHADDPLRRYLPNGRAGRSGAEWAFEEALRGRRGRLRRDRRDRIVEDVAPVNGHDVTLTIRADLQQVLYEIMAGSEALAGGAGGCIVVLDVPTREVLALVSYPDYDPNRFNADYASLRRDTRRQPLRFRAVSNRYAPGSIVKPLACLAGLSSGRITLDTTFECAGYLFPGRLDRWRCWRSSATGQRKRHGALTVPDAIKYSCNIFMYHVGETVGVEYLCSFFEMFGFGHSAGTGLREEAVGINPTPSWLMTHRNQPATVGRARQYAIGQAEVSITPLQAANLMAVYASGVYQPVSLAKGQHDGRQWRLPGAPEHWRAVRRGLYGVVNDPSGTAYHTARLKDDHWAMCGKTGSAEASPWAVSYQVPYVDDRLGEMIAIVPAGTSTQAVQEVRRLHPDAGIVVDGIAVHEWWPAPPGSDERKPSHAWFAAYLQRIDEQGTPLDSVTPRIAFAVMVEFGGSGGRTSGPVARAVAAALLRVLGPELDPDAPALEQVT